MCREAARPGPARVPGGTGFGSTISVSPGPFGPTGPLGAGIGFGGSVFGSIFGGACFGLGLGREGHRDRHRYLLDRRGGRRRRGRRGRGKGRRRRRVRRQVDGAAVRGRRDDGGDTRSDALRRRHGCKMDAGAFITAGLPLVPGTRYTGRVESEPLPNSATQSSAPAPTATTAPNAMTPLRSAFDVRGAAGCVTGVGR